MGTFFPPNPSPSMMSELTVLGSAMREASVLDSITLTREDFESQLTGDAYELMQKLHAEGKPIDAASLGYADPEHTGMYWEIADYGHPGWDYHAEQVRANAVRWRLEQSAHEITTLAKDTSTEIDDVTELARRLVDDAIGIRQARPNTSEDLVPRVIESIGKATVGISTPWRSLTRIIRGFRPGGLYVVAARPGIGKSALALQMAMELEKYGSVGFFTLEMGENEVTQRLIAQGAYVPLPMVDGSEEMTEDMRQRMLAWHSQYHGRILFDDRGTVTIQEIRAQVRTWMREYNLVGVVVDYLQLIDGPANWTKVQIVSEVSRALKVMAKDFNIPVIALSQLNRNPEARVDKRPALGDLRESGSIEQDADVVMLLYNSTQATGENTSNVGDDLEVIVAKSRQGPTMTAHLLWQGRYVTAFDPA